MACIDVIDIGHKVVTIDTIVCENPRILEKIHIFKFIKYLKEICHN